MAISAELLKLSQRERVSGPFRNTFLQCLVDEDPVYVPRTLSVLQFATLSAVLKRFMKRPYTKASPVEFAEGLDAGSEARAYAVGLDELDVLARTRAGYAFAELTAELQDVVLDLIASGYISTKTLDLGVWLEDLRHHALPDLAWASNRL